MVSQSNWESVWYGKLNALKGWALSILKGKDMTRTTSSRHQLQVSPERGTASRAETSYVCFNTATSLPAGVREGQSILPAVCRSQADPRTPHSNHTRTTKEPEAPSACTKPRPASASASVSHWSRSSGTIGPTSHGTTWPNWGSALLSQARNAL